MTRMTGMTGITRRTGMTKTNETGVFVKETNIDVISLYLFLQKMKHYHTQLRRGTSVWSRYSSHLMSGQKAETLSCTKGNPDFSVAVALCCCHCQNHYIGVNGTNGYFVKSFSDSVLQVQDDPGICFFVCTWGKPRNIF